MQDHKTKSISSDAAQVKPKRKIIHRIVRRVPKAKIPETIQKPHEDEIFNEVISAPRILKHGDNPTKILADEKPVYSDPEVIQNNDLLKNEDIGPKEMILKELSQAKEVKKVPSQISYNQLDSTAKNPIANIWPYIAASKQQSKDEIEATDRKFSGDDNDDDVSPEHNYFSWIPWVIIPLIVTGIVIFVMSYLAGADVVITPKTKNLTIATDLVAEKNADQTKSIPLTVLLIEDKVTSDVPASESKTTIATASGKITVSNKQKIVQTLIKTTRFESADGKIYRIRDNVKVPAAVNDKPGQIDVIAYAESAGPEYNKKDPTDFTIPGFKGKPQFQLVTARSIGSIGGGSSGVKKSVPKEVMDELAKNMRIDLENKLRARVTRELLQNQVGYESLYQFEYKEVALEASDAPEKARVAMSGTLAVPVFDKADLARELAKASIEGYTGESITLDKIEQLNVKFSEGQKINIFTDPKVSFRFDGDAKFTWSVDSKAFAKALINVSQDDTSRVSKRFSGIEKVSATLRPFWKSYFPSNVKDINVVVLEAGK